MNLERGFIGTDIHLYWVLQVSRQISVYVNTEHHLRTPVRLEYFGFIYFSKQGAKVKVDNLKYKWN